MTMNITTQSIDRVTVTRDPGEHWPQCPTWSKNFVIEPEKLIIEFDRHASSDSIGLLHLKAEGDRIRLLKAGPKRVGTGHDPVLRRPGTQGAA